MSQSPLNNGVVQTAVYSTTQQNIKKPALNCNTFIFKFLQNLDILTSIFRKSPLSCRHSPPSLGHLSAVQLLLLYNLNDFANPPALFRFTPICEKQPFLPFLAIFVTTCYFRRLQKPDFLPFFYFSQTDQQHAPKGTFANFSIPRFLPQNRT